MPKFNQKIRGKTKGKETGVVGLTRGLRFQQEKEIQP
jgi:hypothetical protein